MSAARVRAHPARSRRARRPRVRDEVRLMVARRGRPLVHDMLPRPARPPARRATCWSSTTSRDDARGARPPRGQTATPSISTSRRPMPGEPPPPLGGRAAPRRRRATAAPRRRALALPAGGARRAARALSRRPAGCGSPRSTCPSRCSTTSPRTARRSATRHSPSRARSRTTRRSSPTEPGSAEMPSAGRPFTQRVLARPASRAASASRRSCSTPASRSLERGERPYPERYAVPAHTAARVNAHRAAGGRVIAVGTTVVRALETVAAPGRRGPRRRGLDEPRRSRPSAASAPSTGCSPAGTSRTPATC